MGIPEEETAEVEGAGGDDGEGEDGRFKVWPENERALGAFLAVRRQWRIGPMGGFLGLDPQGVESLLRMSKIEVDADLLDDLAAIEGGALEVLNAKQ
jgi:hypothetical protein